MVSLKLARGRALSGCAWVALAAALAGCTASAASNNSSISGTTLTIYLSAPAGSLTSEQQDVIAAERLAFHEIGGQVGKFTVKLVQANGSELSDNARGAIADPTTIAYLGELAPGTSGQTIGITNAETVLQVSPTDNASELTQSSPAVSGSPGLYYESLSANGRTFARLVPTDKLEAKALVSEMQTLGVKHLAISLDGSAYGNAFSASVISDAPAAGINVVPTSSQADAVLYAGMSAPKATTTLDGAAASNPSLKLFAPSALADAAFAGGLSSAAQHDLIVSSPGFMTSDLPPQGSQFDAAFKAAAGHQPAPEAIFGYEAVAAVLAAIHRAGASANARSTVVHDLLGIKRNAGWPQSAIGTYSIDKNGDVSYPAGAPFVFSRIEGGKLVAFKAVQQQG